MHRIRMLALDVDGTLAAKGDEVTPRTREALAMAREHGIEVVIATGRRYRTTRRIVEALGMPVPAVCLGGALIKDHEEQTLFTSRFDEDAFATVHGLALELDIALVGHLDSHRHGGADFVVDSGTRWNRNVEAYLEANREFFGTRRFDDGKIHEEVIVLGSFAAREQLDALEARLAEKAPGRFLTSVVPSFGVTEWYVEIIPADVSKWAGLERLSRHLGIGADEICAVGDQVNDLPMIRSARIGVAMGNGSEVVKREADLVTGRHDEDGIADLVERLLAAGEARPQGSAGR